MYKNLTNFSKDKKSAFVNRNLVTITDSFIIFSMLTKDNKPMLNHLIQQFCKYIFKKCRFLLQVKLKAGSFNDISNKKESVNSSFIKGVSLPLPKQDIQYGIIYCMS